MTERIKITEEEGIHKQWYDEAKAIKGTAELPAFIAKLTDNYDHDYGTICHAVAAAGLAAMNAVNRSEQGGITGFQASCIMWEIIQYWSLKEPPLRLLELKDMIYPQSEYKFNTIAPDIWEIIQDEARKCLDDKSEDGQLHPKVKAHMESIVAGEVPFGYKVRED